jgi:hypothetical protein
MVIQFISTGTVRSSHVVELEVTAIEDGDAYQAAYDIALRMGYTRPKWWQFWRWQDSMPPAPFDVNEPNEKE